VDLLASGRILIDGTDISQAQLGSLALADQIFNM
jgi:hypothetical protein